VDPIYPNGRHLIALPVSPLINSVAIGLGGLLFVISRRRERPRPGPLAGAS
jgi:hypothetical protein